MIARPCPRCGRYVPVGQACSCRGAVQRGKRDSAYDARRDPEIVKFYHSAAWKKLRQEKLRRNPFCERCAARGAKPVPPAVEVHHVATVKASPSKRLDIDNLQSLCHACHAAATRAERRAGGR